MQTPWYYFVNDFLFWKMFDLLEGEIVLNITLVFVELRQQERKNLVTAPENIRQTYIFLQIPKVNRYWPILNGKYNSF